MKMAYAAITLEEFRAEIVTELRHRAWQERASARIGRTKKSTIAEHEHAAVAHENLACDVERIELRQIDRAQFPASSPQDADAAAEWSIDAQIAERS
jgi:hypothetical protein